MSTKCNVVIKDADSELIFYRHSDGYPDGTLPTLKKFMQWVADGYIRPNVTQASGWLVLIGAREYQVDVSGDLPPKNWKCGAYEPTDNFAGDIDFIYILDLDNLTISVRSEYQDKIIAVIQIESAEKHISI
jgi:hypothetical protein